MTKDEKIKYITDLGFSIMSENLADNLEVMCSNGHIFKRTFYDFTHKNNKCNICTEIERKKYIESLGYKILPESTYSKLIVQCKNGHTFKREYSKFLQTSVCNICISETNMLKKEATKNKSIEWKKQRIADIQALGYQPVSNDINLLSDKLQVLCENNHLISRPFERLKRHPDCPQCFKESKIKSIQNKGFTLLSKITENMELMCSQGHIFKRLYGNFLRGDTICPICFPNTSTPEKEVQQFLEEHSILAKNDWSVLEGKELDLYLPEHSLAIEHNGIYWHSEKQGKGKKYHLEKTQKCLEQNISLLHIFENEWKHPTKREIWKSIVLGKIGKHKRVFARKTILKTVSKIEEKAFLEENHLQGSVGSKVALGLYLGEELQCLMSFGKNRMSNDVEWELLRFASKKGVSVVGGASKLFKHFLNNFTGGIVSYSDRRYSQGNMYSKLGFTFSHFSEPNYFYFKNGSLKLESRQKYMKHKLPKLLEKFDPSLTEVENMKSNGFDRIWDCGNSVWKFKR